MSSPHFHNGLGPNDPTFRQMNSPLSRPFGGGGTLAEAFGNPAGRAAFQEGARQSQISQLQSPQGSGPALRNAINSASGVRGRGNFFPRERPALGNCSSPAES